MESRSMRRGEIWLLTLDPTVGAEIQKTRPAIIVSDDSIGLLPLKVVVPVTDWKDRYTVAPWMVRLDPNAENGLNKPSAADSFQVRSLAQRRFIRRVGKISDDQLRLIAEALAVVLKIRV
jgi:mRNA interferase MazF